MSHPARHDRVGDPRIAKDADTFRQLADTDRVIRTLSSFCELRICGALNTHRHHVDIAAVGLLEHDEGKDALPRNQPDRRGERASRHTSRSAFNPRPNPHGRV